MNTELASTYFELASTSGNAGLGSYETLGTTFLSTDQNIILFYVCFGLKIPYVINIVDSLSMNSELTAL